MANANQITQGSKEYMFVDVVDLTGQITDLTGTSPIYDIVQPDGTTYIVTGATGVIGKDGNNKNMRVYCLVDTSSGSGLGPPAVPQSGWWNTNVGYRLYVKFTTAPEAPRLGPELFDVVN